MGPPDRNGSCAVEARAKLNLCLHITGRRPDGLHAMESLVVFPQIGDRIEVARVGALELALDPAAPFAGALPRDHTNLVLRAARLLQTEASVSAGARLRLAKHLPVAAGLGGGSADAAAALRALRRLWNAPVSDRRLAEIAWRLGADLPVCLRARPTLVAGGGERLSPAPALPVFWVVLVYPGQPLATADVFRALDPRAVRGRALPTRPEGFGTLAELVDWLQGTRNDLAAAAARILPVCDNVRRALAAEGAVLVRMSGSGSGHFGIFADAGAARRAAAALARANPGWWCRAAQAGGSVRLA